MRFKGKYYLVQEMPEKLRPRPKLAKVQLLTWIEEGMPPPRSLCYGTNNLAISQIGMAGKMASGTVKPRATAPMAPRSPKTWNL